MSVWVYVRVSVKNWLKKTLSLLLDVSGHLQKVKQQTNQLQHTEILKQK